MLELHGFNLQEVCQPILVLDELAHEILEFDVFLRLGRPARVIFLHASHKVLGKPSVELQGHGLSQGVGFRDDSRNIEVSVLLLLIHTRSCEVLLQF